MYFATTTMYVIAMRAYNRRTESKDVCFMNTANNVKQEYIEVERGTLLYIILVTFAGRWRDESGSYFFKIQMACFSRYALILAGSIFPALVIFLVVNN
jgi:hypothetical protein